jgi:hypothetical protein
MKLLFLNIYICKQDDKTHLSKNKQKLKTGKKEKQEK